MGKNFTHGFAHEISLVQKAQETMPPESRQWQQSWAYFIKRRVRMLPYPVFYTAYSLTSGSPATEVSRDSTPASREVEPTVIQLTSPSTAAVPMAATAV